VCGLHIPVAPGISPGSGPSHLALFGYDPITHDIGRGVLEALGVGLEVGPSDIAARANFCTVDENGVLTDRRAGRQPTNETALICEQLTTLAPDGVAVDVRGGMEHRFAVVFRDIASSDRVSGSDPEREGVAPFSIRPLAPDAERTAGVANSFIAEAKALLAGRQRGNMILMRGFAKYPTLPQMPDVYKIRAAAIATYPMYRGLSSLLGMDVLSAGKTISDEVETLRTHWKDYTYFFVHYKATDSAGEDGDFPRKVQALEDIDALIPRIEELEPDVLMVTGDHSTPAVMANHSWHSVPFMLISRHCRPDAVRQFSEPACAGGALGTFPAVQAMSLAMANALKLNRYGA
jgi:2,3-bisphosphoglycerate-independent phosphoglycerate mutase